MEFYEQLKAALKREVRDSLGFEGSSLVKFTGAVGETPWTSKKVLQPVMEGVELGIRLIVDQYEQRVQLLAPVIPETEEEAVWYTDIFEILQRFRQAFDDVLKYLAVDVLAIYNRPGVEEYRAHAVKDVLPKEVLFTVHVLGRQLQFRVIEENVAHFTDGNNQYRIAANSQFTERMSFSSGYDSYFPTYMWSKAEQDTILQQLIKWTGGKIEVSETAKLDDGSPARRCYFVPKSGLKVAQGLAESGLRRIEVGGHELQITRHYKHTVYFMCNAREYCVNKWGCISRVSREFGRPAFFGTTDFGLQGQDKIVEGIMSWGGGHRACVGGEDLLTYKRAA